MRGNNSGFAVLVFSILFVGLTLTIMQGMGIGQREVVQAQPTRNLPATAAVLAPTLDITTTPTPRPKAELVQKVDRPTQTAIKSDFNFTDSVPAADSPEFTADGMRACFSMYTRNKNLAEGTCKGEWYPVDYAPRSYDQYWCATNAGVVEWVPVRFFDGRTSEIVEPFGSLGRCE